MLINALNPQVCHLGGHRHTYIEEECSRIETGTSLSPTLSGVRGDTADRVMEEELWIRKQPLQQQLTEYKQG